MNRLIRNKRTLIVWILLVSLLIFVWLLQRVPSMSEWYARAIYPVLSNLMSTIAHIFPFSLSDLFILLSILGIFAYPFYARSKRKTYKAIFAHIALYLGYVYVWFYLAWGLNYFRQDYYTRAAITPVAYDSIYFQLFLSEFVTNINQSYRDSITIDTIRVQQTGKTGYQQLSATFHMMPPTRTLSPKPMISSEAMAKVGVLGYMAPFFSEFCVNNELLPVQYPFTYMHELSHRLGIASEAEANLYAFLICSASEDENIRFSGYMALFPYVLGNARGALGEEDYRKLLTSFRPEILALYKQNRAYWDAKYSPLIGELQHKVYNLFLKGNNIKHGTANYSQVIGLLLSLKQAKHSASLYLLD